MGGGMLEGLYTQNAKNDFVFVLFVKYSFENY